MFNSGRQLQSCQQILASRRVSRNIDISKFQDYLKINREIFPYISNNTASTYNPFKSKWHKKTLLWQTDLERVLVFVSGIRQYILLSLSSKSKYILCWTYIKICYYNSSSQNDKRQTYNWLKQVSINRFSEDSLLLYTQFLRESYPSLYLTIDQLINKKIN